MLLAPRSGVKRRILGHYLDQRKQVNMFKRALLILFGVVLVAQLTGCFFEDRDGHRWHHERHHDHDSGIDVRVHG
jgi:hypothetical protein